jgi:hypothetical protein
MACAFFIRFWIATAFCACIANPGICQRVSAPPVRAAAATQISVAPRTASSQETLTRYIRLRNRIRNLRVDSHFEGIGGLVLQGFSGELGRGTINVKGNVNWARPDEQQWAKMTLTSVDARSFLDAFDIGMDGRIFASVTGWADLQWRGRHLAAMKKSLVGTAELRIGKGYVENSRVLSAVAEVSGIQALQKLEFSAGKMRGHAAHGTLYVDELDLEAPMLHATLSGTIDLASDQINLRPKFWISPQLANTSTRPELRTAVQFLDGMRETRESNLVQIPLPIVFTGTIRKPAVRMDTGEQ